MSNSIDLNVQLKNILNDRFGIALDELSDESRLGDLGIDSLHLVDVMLDLETVLEIKLTDLSLPANPSLVEVAETIRRNINEQN